MRFINRLSAILLLALGSWSFAQEILVQPISGIDGDFIRGADVSSLAQIEECGGTYRDLDGTEKDLLEILKNHGVNWIRLRLWNNPVNDLPVLEGGKVISNKGQRVGGGTNDLERDIALAKRAKALGLKVLLDFHYSDFWTDPGKQNKPAAWKDLAGKDLEKALYNYTRSVIERMSAEEVKPDMVQIGNELNNGLLWPNGKIWGDSNEKTGGFPAFTGLLKQAAKAVRDADQEKKGDGKIRIAIHLADGGNNGLYRTVFDEIRKAKIDYDIIGLSFYTYWHGSIASLKANMDDISARYGKDVIVMETAYGFTEGDGDDFGNVFKVYNDETGGYKASVQGQATAVRDVMAAVAAVRGGRGLGAFYWEPGWIPVVGAGWRTGEGNSWENQAMFNFDGTALPSVEVFSKISDHSAPSNPPVPVETIPVELKVTVGEKPKLPDTVCVSFSDDSLRYLPVIWDKADFTGQTKTGIVTLKGKVTGQNLEARAVITFTLIKNLIDDPSFEKGNLEGWTYSGPKGACFTENNSANAQTGNWTYKYWLDKAFKSMLTRTFTGLENGSYVLKCASMGGGGENSLKLFARDFGGDRTVSATMVNTGWQAWSSWETPRIEVTNGQCTIGIYIDAKAGNWGNFDDIEFYLDPETKAVNQ